MDDDEVMDGYYDDLMELEDGDIEQLLKNPNKYAQLQKL